MAVSQNLTLTQVSQNIAENYSTVRVLWTSTQTGQSYNAYTRTAQYYVSLNGGSTVTYNVTYTLPKNATGVILDTTIKVPHKADGTASIGVSTWMNTGISAGEIKLSKSLQMTLPRMTTPTLSASAVDMGSKVTVTMNRATSDFVHDLYYSFAGEAFQYIAGDLATSYSWTVPDLATKIPNTTSGTVTVRCVTRSGSTTIGTKDVLLTVRVPGSVMPTISGLTITEATANLAAQFGAFVKNKSTLSVTVNAEGAKGSTIKSYSTTLQGKVYNEKTFTTDKLTSSGTVSLVTTVTDSRGRSVKLTTNVNVLDYSTPTIPNFIAYRVDANGNAKNDGKYLCVDYSYVVATVGNKNTASMTLSYKRSTATTWTVLTTSSAYTGAAVRTFTTEFTPDYQFDIMLEVEDWFKAKATYVATLPTAKVILDIKAAGDGLAVGKTAEFPGFEVDMVPGAESFKMVGVHSYEIGDGSGYILYNNGLLLQWGFVSITPTAVNTVTALTILFPKPYKARPHITGTPLVNSPQALTWSLGIGTTDEAGLTRLVLYMYRSTLHATPFRWMAVGQADMTGVIAE